jgi:hypothetical protein
VNAKGIDSKALVAGLNLRLLQCTKDPDDTIKILRYTAYPTSCLRKIKESNQQHPVPTTKQKLLETWPS